MPNEIVPRKSNATGSFTELEVGPKAHLLVSYVEQPFIVPNCLVTAFCNLFMLISVLAITAIAQILILDFHNVCYRYSWSPEDEFEYFPWTHEPPVSKSNVQIEITKIIPAPRQ